MRIGVLVVAGVLAFAATACDSGSESASEPTSTTGAPTSSTTPRSPARATTRWHPMDKVRAPWPAALAAIRSSPTAAVAVERLVPILRAARQASSERVTARVVDGDAPGESLIVIAWRGFADDSVSGSDSRIRVIAGSGGLVIRGKEGRAICARGIGTDPDVCI